MVALCASFLLCWFLWLDDHSKNTVRGFAKRVWGGNLSGALPFGSVADRVEMFGPAVELRLKPDFDKAGVAWPPGRVLLLGIKDERRLELYASSDSTSAWRRIRRYPVLAASGKLGPKLREGDLQVPEGVYGIESLNPNSRFHLSLRVNYPNEFDKLNAAAERRTKLGGDIMIHGDSVSIGCLAMGDPASEELFVLAALAGIENITVLLSPVDFRTRAYSPGDAQPWVLSLYDRLRTRLNDLPLQ